MLGEDIRWIASWRVEQEERMKAVKGEGMSEGQIQEFVKPYIPFTWLYYDQQSRIKADCELVIGEDHLPRSLNIH
jgi:pantothenate kinase-related protein Tda10